MYVALFIYALYYGDFPLILSMWEQSERRRFGWGVSFGWGLASVYEPLQYAIAVRVRPENPNNYSGQNDPPVSA